MKEIETKTKMKTEKLEPKWKKCKRIMGNAKKI